MPISRVLCGKRGFSAEVFLKEHNCGFAQTFLRERVSESSQKLEATQAPWHERLRVAVPIYRQFGVAKEPRQKRPLEV